ncbi:MAG: hypothetical protein LBD48_00445 [Treponema sp.]|nr:hypothetical protein [Treponema sp.]
MKKRFFQKGNFMKGISVALLVAALGVTGCSQPTGSEQSPNGNGNTDIINPPIVIPGLPSTQAEADTMNRAMKNQLGAEATAIYNKLTPYWQEILAYHLSLPKNEQSAFYPELNSTNRIRNEMNTVIDLSADAVDNIIRIYESISNITDYIGIILENRGKTRALCNRQ